MNPFRRLAWRAVLRTSGGTLSMLTTLRRAQWLPPAQAQADADARLSALLTHAVRTVPWYRETVGPTLELAADGSVPAGALTRFPLLDKDMIRGAGPRLLSSAPATGRYENTSGGSTGEPVRLIQDAAYRDSVRAVAMLFNEFAAYETGDTMVKVWGSERDLFDGGENLRTRTVRWLRGEHWLNAFRMSPAQIRAHLETIRRLRPGFVLGYVESLYDLARHAEREGVSLPSPRSVMSAAGPLEPPVREVIERVFGARVFNRYGSREVGDVACECEAHQGLHVCLPTHHVEVLRPDGSPAPAGEVGELVVTLLTNRSMPLIRYRIGDTAAWAAQGCTCGRSWPLLTTIAGRVSDMFVRPDGVRVHGEYFTHLFYFLPWVGKFQVVQETPDRIRVRIVLRDTDSAPAEALDDIRSKIQLVMGEECRVAFEYPPLIEPTASGKFRYTISHVAS